MYRADNLELLRAFENENLIDDFRAEMIDQLNNQEEELIS